MSFIKIVPKDYLGYEALPNVIRYCLRNDNEYIERYGAGIVDNCAENIINGFNFVKKYYGKMDGKQLHHFVISIYRYKYITNNKDWKAKKENESIACKLLAKEVPIFIRDNGFQCCSFIHEDTDYLHIHLIVNSVSWKDGHKLTNVKSFANIILRYVASNYAFLNWERGIRW